MNIGRERGAGIGGEREREWDIGLERAGGRDVGNREGGGRDVGGREGGDGRERGGMGIRGGRPGPRPSESSVAVSILPIYSSVSERTVNDTSVALLFCMFFILFF